MQHLSNAAHCRKTHVIQLQKNLLLFIVALKKISVMRFLHKIVTTRRLETIEARLFTKQTLVAYAHTGKIIVNRQRQNTASRSLLLDLRDHHHQPLWLLPN